VIFKFNLKHKAKKFLDTYQIQTQKAIACNQERGKLTALIITQNPKITPKELDNILNVVCK
jgi:hypothetical protein